MLGSRPPTDADPYLSPRPKGEAKVLPVPKFPRSIEDPSKSDSADSLPSLDKTKPWYHLNKLTGVHRLCIPLLVAPDILDMTYGEEHLSFSRCYEIITRFWFIGGLTKLLRTFICHCHQCLAL